MSDDQYINRTIFSKYKILKKIGKGSFGTVYSGIIILTEKEIAIKIEKKDKIKKGTLESEAHKLIYIQGEGIPKIYCFGNNMTHNLLVIELLGKSLDEIFNSIKKFSLKTICVLGIEMIKRIKYLHSKNYIHRDIKPENFLMGKDENSNKIYLIDFGLSKKYYSKSKNEHIKFETGKGIIGTARYCSRNAHKGFEQGRRDDIESIGYVLVYFFLGYLPWQKIKVKNNEDYYDKIGKKKINTTFEDLTKGLPQEFLFFFKYIDSLNFEDEPNYDFLINLFQDIINKSCSNCFYDFDWNKEFMSYPPLNQEIKNDNCSKKDISLIALKESKYDISDYNSENEINEQNIIIQNYENLKRKNRQRSKSIFTQGRLSNDKYFLDKYKINFNDCENYKNKSRRSSKKFNLNNSGINTINTSNINGEPTDTEINKINRNEKSNNIDKKNSIKRKRRNLSMSDDILKDKTRCECTIF